MLKNPKMNNRRGTSLNLVQSDPLKRLGELCKKGGYYYNMSWDIFSNGIMMECTMFHIRGRYVLYREVRFVENPKNITGAKKVISAILLDNIGLGMEEDISHEEEEIPYKIHPLSTESQNESEEGEDIYEDAAKDVTRMGINFLAGVLSEVSQKNSDLGSKIPEDAMQGLLKGIDIESIDSSNISNILKLLTPSSGLDEQTVKDDPE